MNVILKLKLKFELKSLFFWAATVSLTCRLWRTEERAHRSAIKLQFSGHHFEIISHRILVILKHGFLQKCLHTIGNRKHCDADLDNCLRVASLGRLGAMLGKLPSLETRSKVRIHQGAAGIAGVAAVGGHQAPPQLLHLHHWQIGLPYLANLLQRCVQPELKEVEVVLQASLLEVPAQLLPVPEQPALRTLYRHVPLG